MTDKPTPSENSLFEQAGGEAGIRAVIELFYERMFEDSMIGFFFRDADKQRLIDKECELTATFLGADHITYTGHPLPTAHGKHPILGGHFDRRTQILRDCMDALAVPDPVRQAWIQHTESLRQQITRDKGSDCNHERGGWKPPSER